MALQMSRRAAEKLARRAGQPPPETPLPSPLRGGKQGGRRVTLDERLSRAGWMPRCRVLGGREVHDYWQASGSGESAGVAETYMEARRLALDKMSCAAEGEGTT